MEHHKKPTGDTADIQPKQEPETTNPYVTIDNLQKELDQTRAQLNEIVSLRRRAKKAVKRRVKNLDSLIIRKLKGVNRYTSQGVVVNDNVGKAEELLAMAHVNDVDNFEKYNKAPKDHPLLSPYSAARSVLKSSVAARRAKKQRREV